MAELTQEQQTEFLDKHLQHRRTLLLTLRNTRDANHSWQNQDKIYCCVIDSNLIAVRLLLNFLGLKGRLVDNKYSLEKSQPTHDDDIKITHFGQNLRLVSPQDISQEYHRLLAGICIRADKELAHLTSTFYDEFNDPDKLIMAATLIEGLLEKFLYLPLSKKIPVIKGT